MALIDDLRENRRLARMRLGQEAPDIVTLISAPEIRFALVPLTEAEYERALHAAASLEIAENAYGMEGRDRALQIETLLYALRDPADPSKRAFDNSKELAELLESIDINHLTELYARLADDSSPSLEGLSETDLEQLKKALNTIDWSVLSGRPWFHLKAFFLTLTPGQLKVNSSGFSSIKSLIGTKENPESTPGAEKS